MSNAIQQEFSFKKNKHLNFQLGRSRRAATFKYDVMTQGRPSKDPRRVRRGAARKKTENVFYMFKLN